MKMIIYAGIGLFAAASVYGVTDYFKSRKTLGSLYTEDEPEAVVTKKATIAEEKILPSTTAVVNPGTTVTKKEKVKAKKRTKRSFQFEDFSRGKPVRDIEELEPTIAEPVPVPAEPAKVEPVKVELPKEMPAVTTVVAAEPPRRIDLSSFSRAPLKPRKLKKG